MTALKRWASAGIAAACLGAALVVTPSLGGEVVASAAPIVDFDPGYIISDGQMYDATSMTAAQIATLLNDVGKACAPSSGNTCLKSYRETTPSRPANNLCTKAYAGATNETAASILAKVGVACGINPQVLIVTLQKEQGLVTSTAGKPAATYSRALGFGCPDNVGGWCNPDYAGFANQVYSAAQQLRRYAASPTSYSHRAGATNNIRFSPDASCGSAPVFIQNQATASLYNYTPYQPNAAALAAGSGTGDSCSSYGNRNFHIFFKHWFGSPTGNRNPFGHLDSVAASGPGSVTVRGWAVDRDAEPINVHVYIDGKLAGALTAATPRSDIERIYRRSTSGFSGQFPAAAGKHSVCVYAINSPAGANIQLGCGSATVVNRRPFGVLDSAVAAPGGVVTLRGWALDPDTTNPIPVHVYVDGRLATGVSASGQRPDVGRAYGFGDRHGFTISVPAEGGRHRICVYAIDSSGGPNPAVACRDVTVTNAAPKGVLDGVDVTTPSAAVVAGWAFDPDSSAPTSVDVLVGGVVVATQVTSVERPDVVRVVGAPLVSGYRVRVPLTAGSRTVCVDARDAATGVARRVGCRTVDVPSTPPAGSLDTVAPGVASVAASGWAWDYDAPQQPVPVKLTIDGVVAAQGTAGQALAAAPSGVPTSSAGYALVARTTPGKHAVCVQAVDAPSGTTRQLGCQSLTVANSDPFGSLDSAVAETGGLHVRGWAMDPDTTEAINVHVYVDGKLVLGATANGSRPDVDRAYGNGAAHGYSLSVPATSGQHEACVWAINWPAGANIRSNCRTVDVP